MDRSDLPDKSRRTVSDRSAQSDLSTASDGSVVDDSDSGIVKHVVYERCWKDTASLLSYASSQGSSGPLSKKCAPLLSIPTKSHNGCSNVL